MEDSRFCLAGDAIYTQSQFKREVADGVADDKKAAVTTMNQLRSGQKEMVVHLYYQPMIRTLEFCFRGVMV